MPSFDRACTACDWATDFSLESSTYTPKPCPVCGAGTVRFLSRAPFMVRDTFGTPLVDSNMSKTTQVFQTRSEHKAAMKAHGVALMDSHVGVPGTDKSPMTQRWTSGMAPTESDHDRAARLAHDEVFQAARQMALRRAERADWKAELLKHESD